MPFALLADVLLAARIVLFVIPLSGALSSSRSPAPIDTVQQINRCLTAVRVAVSRRNTTERGVETVQSSAVGSERI
jgi:hypothetical protein